jgi:hypothetical protein
MKVPPPNPKKEAENVVDLSDVLGKTTEKKNPGAPEVNSNNKEAESVENTTQEAAPVQNQVNEQTAAPDDAFAPEAPKPPDPPKPEIKIDYTDQANTMIMTLDMASQITLPMVYRRRMFTKEDRENFKEIKSYWKVWKAGKLKEDSLSEEEQKLIRIYDEYKEIVDAIEFSEKEINMLTNPLALMLQKYNMQSGPEASFIFAIVTVMGPRIMPLFIRD